jgi:general secretion pathway protein L
MSRKVLGLDIRATSVCAVLVKSSLRVSRIAGCQSVPIPAETEDGRGGLRAALETIAATIDLHGADCAVSIPAVHFSCRNVHIPFANPKKIRMVLPLEIEPSLPFAADDLAFDFSVLGPGSVPGQTEVLAAAVERSRLAGILETLAAMRLDPERITLGGYPAALSVARSSEADGTVLCVDVSDLSGAIYGVAGGRVRLIRSFPLPPSGPGRARTVQHHLRMTVGALAETGELDATPCDAVLTGVGLEGVDLEEFAAALPVAVRPLDLRDELGFYHEGENDPAWRPYMGGALALAVAEIEGLGGLNFHHGQFPGRKLLSRHRSHIVRTGILAAAVLVLMFASALTQSVLLQRRIDDLDGRMAAVFKETFPEVKRPADPFQQMRIALQELKKGASPSGESLPTVRSIDLLKSVSESIPEEITVVFDRMVIGPDTFLISGTTSAFNSVDEIKGHLERIPKFKKVTISSANTDRSGKEINFQIKVDL